MQNAFFPHMEWAKAQARRRVPVQLGFSGAPAPGRPALAEHGPAEGDLIARIAKRYRVPRRNVYLTGGTSLANFLAVAAFTDPGHLVAVETPRYGALAEIPRALGCRVVDLSRAPGRPLPRPPSRASLAIVTSPHNPTGLLLTAEEWSRLEAFADRGGIVLVDEVYRDLQARPPPVAARRHPRFLTTASFTKAYGLGALRLGWILGAPSLLACVARVDNLVSVAVSMPSVLEALRLWPRLDALRRKALRSVATNLATLRAARLPFVEPDAGLTALVEVGDGDRVAAALEKSGVAVAPGSFFEAPRCVRLFLGAPPAIFRRGVSALAARTRRRAARSG
jgi:aspartate/methionine/tyrosine aminotransferase